MMNVWDIIIDQIKLNFFEFVSEGHAFLIHNALQSFLFMMAIMNVISWIFTKLNLFFARNFSKSNGILKLIIFVLFLYIKIWDAYSPYFEILGYFCSVSISIHLYEGCVRLGTYFCRKYSKNSFGNISSAISILLIFLSYKVFRLSQLEQTEGKYHYVPLYFMVFGLILFISVLKRKQFIYILIIMTIMSSIIISRFWFEKLLQGTFLYKVNLPFESVVYGLFALQENYNWKEDEAKLKKLKGQIQQHQSKTQVSQLFWAQIYYFWFFLVNKRMYNIQIVFASVCVLNYLGTTRIN